MPSFPTTPAVIPDHPRRHFRPLMPSFPTTHAVIPDLIGNPFPADSLWSFIAPKGALLTHTVIKHHVDAFFTRFGWNVASALFGLEGGAGR